MPETIASQEFSPAVNVPPTIGDAYTPSYSPPPQRRSLSDVIDGGNPEPKRTSDTSPKASYGNSAEEAWSEHGQRFGLETTANRQLYLRVCRITDTATASLLIAVIAVINERMPLHLSELLAHRVELKSVVFLLIFAAVWSPMIRLFGTYDPRVNLLPVREAMAVVTAVTAAMLLSLVVSVLVPSDVLRPTTVLWAWPVLVGATLTVRWAAKACIAARQPREVRRVLILGSGPRALRTYRQLCQCSYVRYEVVGFADTARSIAQPELRERMLGSLSELERLLMSVSVDEVLIALPIKSCYEEIQRAIEVCERMGIESRYLSDVFRGGRIEADLDSRMRSHALSVSDDSSLAAKRLLDLLGAAIGLVLFSPLLLVIAMVIRIDTRGPTLFVQDRYGLRKRRFKMYKFRTMVADAEMLQPSLEHRNEAIGPIFKIRRDPRVTQVGRWLRATSLDELPQLWNVLTGDMSLVGPRPMSLRDVHQFAEPWFIRRFSVRPGITGLWQVSGRSNLPFESWIALDLQYIDNWSLTLDLKILARTIPAVVRCTGAA